MKAPHYFCKSCQLSIPITLKEVYENTDYHKKRFDKVLKQGIMKFNLDDIMKLSRNSSPRL